MGVKPGFLRYAKNVRPKISIHLTSAQSSSHPLSKLKFTADIYIYIYIYIYKGIYLSIFPPNLYSYISQQMSQSKSVTTVGTRAFVILTTDVFERGYVVGYREIQ